MQSTKYHVIIIGGGAAGYFTAINIKEKRPDLSVLILEKSNDVLQKVKISGGGRCNVTHACFEPKPLTEHYPRGKKELLGPFHQFMTGDAMEWFEQHGVPLKIEDDQRVFPLSNTSQTIVDCFKKLQVSLGIEVQLGQGVVKFKKSNDTWLVHTKNNVYSTDYLVVSGGSSKSLWGQLQALGHTIVNPVPSLFTFNCTDVLLKDLQGVSVQSVTISLPQFQLKSQGPLLITHWGISGPGVLKLSAFGAIVLADAHYQFDVLVNWLEVDASKCVDLLFAAKKNDAKMALGTRSPFDKISKRFWERFLEVLAIDKQKKWANLSKSEIELLAKKLTQTKLAIDGKSTFKDEFVTAGGVALAEVNFKTFESKLLPHLYLAGEILNIDAITGGFNFQNAWTGGWLVSEAISQLNNKIIKKR